MPKQDRIDEDVAWPPPGREGVDAARPVPHPYELGLGRLGSFRAAHGNFFAAPARTKPFDPPLFGAEDFLRRAAGGSAALLGWDHPSTVASLRDLGQAALTQVSFFPVVCYAGGGEMTLTQPKKYKRPCSFFLWWSRILPRHLLAAALPHAAGPPRRGRAAAAPRPRGLIPLPGALPSRHSRRGRPSGRGRVKDNVGAGEGRGGGTNRSTRAES